MLYIQHATVLTPHRQIDDGAVLIDGPQILAVGPADEISRPAGADEIDASGLILVPGFIDLQINGAFGHDFTADPASIWAVAAQLPRYGVTSFLPTIVTSPLETVAAAQEAVSRGLNYGPAGAIPLGVHIEGPFLNPEKKGAHNPAYLRLPDPEVVRQWSSARGVRLVTLAPELPGAKRGAFYRYLSRSGSGIRRGDTLRDASVQRHAAPSPPRARTGRGIAHRWQAGLWSDNRRHPHPPLHDTPGLARPG